MNWYRFIIISINLMIIYILLVLFLFIIIFSVTIYNKNKYIYNKKKNKWIILLTTAVNNDNNRKQIYLNAIQQWLNKTSFNIFIVESSNYTFSEIQNERLYVYTFNFKNILPSSSQYEANSILNILENIKYNPIYQQCSHILKVTGRYYLHNVEKILNKIEPNKDLYLQIHRKGTWQNSEYVGIRKELLQLLCENIKTEGLIEEKLYNFSLDKTFIHFGPFDNKIKRGGDNQLIQRL